MKEVDIRDVNELWDRLENRHNITVLSMRLRGSRAQGVAHDDSDIDIRGLFVRPAEEYATINKKTQTYELSDGEYDIDVWDIQKFGELLSDSNPDAVEFLMSPRVDEQGYMGMTLHNLAEHTRLNFTHMALYHHYLSLAKSQYNQYIANGNHDTVNREYHILRAIAQAEYVRKIGAVPPINVHLLTKKTRQTNRDLSHALAKCASMKQAGQIEAPAQNGSGAFLEQEEEASMEATDERTNSVNVSEINNVIKEALRHA